MKELLIALKSRYGRAEFKTVSATVLEVIFKKNDEPVLIEKEIEPDRYTISYPQLIEQAKGKRTIHYSTSHHLLLAGVIWILNQVEKNGKVLPSLTS